MKSKNKKVIYELSLIINKEMLEDNYISYKTYKYTEDNILKKLNNLRWSFGFI